MRHPRAGIVTAAGAAATAEGPAQPAELVLEPGLAAGERRADVRSPNAATRAACVGQLLPSAPPLAHARLISAAPRAPVPLRRFLPVHGACAAVRASCVPPRTAHPANFIIPIWLGLELGFRCYEPS